MPNASPSSSAIDNALALALTLIAVILLGRGDRADREFDRRLSEGDVAVAGREKTVRRGGERAASAPKAGASSTNISPPAAPERSISGTRLPLAAPEPTFALLLDPSGDDTERNEDANAFHAARDQHGFVRALIRVIDDRRNGDRFRSFAVQHLWLTYADAPAERAMVLDALRRALDDRAAAVSGEAILALARLDRAEALEAARRRLDDAAASHLHAAAIRALEEMNAKAEVDRIRRFIESADAATAVAAIRCLGSWGDLDSRPVIEKSSRSLNPSIRRCAATALALLSNRPSSAPDAPRSVPTFDRRNQP